MRVIDYLDAKYGAPRSSTILRAEAVALGIPYPPPSGWLKTYGQQEIDSHAAYRLRAALERVRDRKPSAVDGLAVLESAWIELRKVPGGNDPGFLQSKAWKRARYMALQKHGRHCQVCGRGAENGVAINVDHIKPRRLFPALSLDQNNLQVLCGDCNEGKANWDMTDARPP